MKKTTAAFALLAALPLAIASAHPPRMLLDKVSFQITAKQWISTQTALLSVSVNATLNNANLVKARNDIMERLNKIAKAQWHLIDFNRSQDNSGLEKLVVSAQARVEQSALTDVYANAKSVSIPGAQYKVTGIEFKPSLGETQAVRITIREELYKQVQEEMARLNKVYPTQNYTLNHLTFEEGDYAPPSPRAYKANAMSAGAGPGGSLNVSNELIMTAVAEAASNRKEGN